MLKIERIYRRILFVYCGVVFLLGLLIEVWLQSLFTSTDEHGPNEGDLRISMLTRHAKVFCNAISSILNIKRDIYYENPAEKDTPEPYICM